MKTRKNAFIITAIIAFAFAGGSLAAFSAAAAEAESDSGIIPVPEIPNINKPYRTSEELGFNVNELSALFPDFIDYSYENGKVRIEDIGAGYASFNSTVLSLGDDGYWTADYDEPVVYFDEIIFRSSAEHTGKVWQVVYENTRIGAYVSLFDFDGDATYSVSIKEGLDVIYARYYNGDTYFSDTYVDGYLDVHEVFVDVLLDDQDIYVISTYTRDGSLKYGYFETDDMEAALYYFPDRGWSSDSEEFVSCNAPEGFENIGEEFFLESAPALICLHSEFYDATCTSPKICKNCGETEGEPIAHNWAAFEGVCSVCNTSIVPNVEFIASVYENINESGLPYEEIRSHFSVDADVKYEDGKYMIKDIGASSAIGHTNVDWITSELSFVDGYWVYEIGEEIYNDESVDIYVTFCGEIEVGRWKIVYANGRISGVLEIVDKDMKNRIMIYFNKHVDFVETTYRVRNREYRDEYRFGVFSGQRVETYVGEERYTLEYNADGTLDYLHLNAADGNWYYYFPEQGWSTMPGSYDENYACAAPEGYEGADAEYFTSIAPTNVGCTHESYVPATCTEPENCVVCGLPGGEALGHSYGENWKTDDAVHWKECSCGDKANVENHVDNDANEKCDDCDYRMSAVSDDSDVDNDTLDGEGGGLDAGVIVVIVLGAIAVLGGGGFAIFRFVIKKKRR